MTYRERLKITLENSVYNRDYEEFTVSLGDMYYLTNQAERVAGLEENCSHLRKSFQRQRNKAVEGWEKVIELEKENKEYEQALEFYEDKGNYKTVIENDREIIFLGTSLAQMDGGEVARKVLESSGSEGDLDE